MKIHDLHPAPGSVTRRTRVGRGIAAGKGKTAGRGTKGQKSRAGASIPAWFEGGQTPLHIRIPKLRGFRNINDIQYEVVNVGAISAAIEAGKLRGPEGRAGHGQRRHPQAGRARPPRPPAAQDPGHGRGHHDAVRPRRCVHQERAREDRGRGRHRPGHRDPERAARRPRRRGTGRGARRQAGQGAEGAPRRPRPSPTRRPPWPPRPRPRPRRHRLPTWPRRPPTRPTPPPTTARQPCSRHCSTRSARRTSGAGSSTSPGSSWSSGCSRTSPSRASTASS